MLSEVASPMSRLKPFRTNAVIASSISLPPTRIDEFATMPERAMTPISVVPPPILTTMQPRGVTTGSPTPIAAAIGSESR